jgi:hypothetical protein
MASRVLDKKGQAMTLFRFNLGGYDPETPELTTPSLSYQSPCKGVVLPASGGTIEASDDRILSDPRRRQSFRFVILAGLELTFRPRAQDILRTVEGDYCLLGASPLDPAGQGVIIWNCGCSKDVPIHIASAMSELIVDGELVLTGEQMP